MKISTHLTAVVRWTIGTTISSHCPGTMNFWNSSRLGKPNQYRGVAHVVQSGGNQFQCLLCKTGVMHKKSACSHFHSSGHLRRHEAVQRELAGLSKMRFAMFVDSAVVPMISYKPWQTLIKACAFDYVNGKTTYQAFWGAVIQIWLKEITTVLELVLWKSKICDGLTFHAMQQMREYPVLEMDFDTKAFAYYKRVGCGAEVIVPLVMEFLGPAGGVPNLSACTGVPRLAFW